MTSTAVPRSTARLRRIDLRVVLGLALLVAGILGTVAVVQRAGQRVPVLVVAREVPAGQVLPLLGQPGDRGRRQSVAGAQELLQRRGEVAGGQAMQIQQRQHLRRLRRLPCPGGQDRRRKPASLPGGLVDALIVDPRRRTVTAPAAVVTSRSAWSPLRTTSRCPFTSTSPEWASM
jgi:hypothetical protein